MSAPKEPNQRRRAAQGLGARVAVCAAGSTEAVHTRARTLATETGLPLVDTGDEHFDVLLVVADDGLRLRRTGPDAPRPVVVDFINDRTWHLHPRRDDLRQPLARAVGLGRDSPRVVDATAGLGRDAFLLAWLGCTVTAVERSPVVAAMLQDGLERGRRVPALAEIIDRRMKLLVGDSRNVLSGLPVDEAPDVIYLDPMFPLKKKASARANKEMELLQLLVGHDEDVAELFDVARRVARKRVVVKRHPHAPPLAPKPNHAHKGKIARYDVYVR